MPVLQQDLEAALRNALPIDHLVRKSPFLKTLGFDAIIFLILSITCLIGPITHRRLSMFQVAAEKTTLS
jgi:hypothetical protein